MASHLSRLRSLWSWSFLVRFLAAVQDPHGRDDVLDIEPGSPMTQILEVEPDALTHFLDRFRLAAQAVHLRQAGDTWTYLVPDHVAADELAVLLVMRHGMRPGTYDTHVSLQHIQQLRQQIKQAR